MYAAIRAILPAPKLAPGGDGCVVVLSANELCFVYTQIGVPIVSLLT